VIICLVTLTAAGSLVPKLTMCYVAIKVWPKSVWQKFISWTRLLSDQINVMLHSTPAAPLLPSTHTPFSFLTSHIRGTLEEVNFRDTDFTTESITLYIIYTSICRRVHTVQVIGNSTVSFPFHHTRRCVSRRLAVVCRKLQEFHTNQSIYPFTDFMTRIHGGTRNN